MIYWFFFLVFIFSFVLTWLCRLIAIRISLLDVPNSRSSHSAPTPRAGGVSIIVVFFFGGYFLLWCNEIPGEYFWTLSFSSCMVAAIGLLDDYRTLSARLRIVIHFAAAALAVIVFPELSGSFSLVLPGWLLSTLTVLALVWLLNLFNFMDGIDGIAATQCICVCGGAALIIWLNGGDRGTILWLLTLSIACAGFLCWNLPPAKIFLGDVGSGFIGIVLGCFTLLFLSEDGLNIWSWIILQGVFIVDATTTLFRRIIRGVPFYQAHRSHAYQILARQWLSHGKVSSCVAAINVFYLLPLAVVSTRYYDFAFVLCLIALFPLLVLSVWVGAGVKG